MASSEGRGAACGVCVTGEGDDGRRICAPSEGAVVVALLPTTAGDDWRMFARMHAVIQGDSRDPELTDTTAV
jgi:hypothetical protein